MRGVGELRILSQIWWRSDSVWRECIRIMCPPKVDSKIETSWEVRAISGTRRMVDLSRCKALRAISR